MVKNQLAPRLGRRVYGNKSYSWRLCPYSTADISGRIPDLEKSIHYTTSGNMQLDIREGHDMVGFVCRDPNCSFYTGQATTPVTISLRSQRIADKQTGEYVVDTISVDIPVCSGTYFWEK
jgi:hypothetical protein